MQVNSLCKDRRAKIKNWEGGLLYTGKRYFYHVNIPISHSFHTNGRCCDNDIATNDRLTTRFCHAALLRRALAFL